MLTSDGGQKMALMHVVLWLYNAVIHQKDVDGMANSADSIQTAPLGAD